ncbi:MAG TPA: hypothetical protein VK400_06570, partial [Pyrinomonadaceae bacterium]|nr:hypothetical protein [Pyrinomonadaceae bacterium]
YEPMKIFSTYPANRTHYRVGQSRISNGDRTSASLAFQAAYYKMHSGGRVFSGGTNYWAWGVDPFPLGESWVEPGGGWYPTMYRQDAETVTMNILDCFKNGGIDCGENP